jgi:hypothetical protein
MRSKNFFINNRRTQFALLILGGILLSTVFITTLFSTLVADDYSYFSWIQDRGVLGFIDYHYTEHTGRLLQALLVAGGWLLAGDKSVILLPILFIVALLVGLTWLIYRLLPSAQRTKLAAASLAASVTGIFALTLPSMYDSLLWLTSSTVHFAAIVTLVYSIVFIHILLTSRPKWWQTALALSFITLAQTTSEPVALTLGAAVGVLVLIFLVRRDWRRFRTAAIVLAALIVGFLIEYLSPGAVVRRNAEAHLDVIDLRHILVIMPAYFARCFLATVAVWKIALIMGVGIVAGLTLRLRVSSRAFLITTASALTSAYLIFAINGYVGWMDIRGMAIIHTLYLAYLVFAALYLVSLTKYHVLVYVAALVVIVSALPFAVLDTHARIKSMAVREYHTEARTIYIEQQLGVNATALEVCNLPVEVPEETGARDFILNGETVSWFTDAFRHYHHVPPTTSLHVVNCTP